MVSYFILADITAESFGCFMSVLSDRDSCTQAWHILAMWVAANHCPPGYKNCRDVYFLITLACNKLPFLFL